MPWYEHTASMNRRSQDLFKSLRHAYALFIQFLSSNGLIAIALCGAPIYYILGFAVFHGSANSVTYVFSSSVYTLLSILLLFWLLAAISVWKVLPNLLTVSIFVFTCIGHWCLVSGAIMIVYGWSQLPYTYTSYLLSGLLPSILFLLVSGDVMRGVRKRFYAMLEESSASKATATATATVDTTPVNPFPPNEGV